MKRIIYPAILLIVFNSCASTNDGKGTIPPLFNTKWSLKKIYTDEGIRDVQTKAFIRFDREKNSAGGNGSCNTFGSEVTLNEYAISFKNIYSTKMYCEAVQTIENLFFKRLENINRYEIRGTELLLFRDKEIILRFQKE
jgi:heat shock protein HslJ